MIIAARAPLAYDTPGDWRMSDKSIAAPPGRKKPAGSAGGLRRIYSFAARSVLIAFSALIKP